MKYRLLKDLPNFLEGTIFEDSVNHRGIIQVGEQTFHAENYEDWFESINEPQEPEDTRLECFNCGSRMAVTATPNEPEWEVVADTDINYIGINVINGWIKPPELEAIKEAIEALLGYIYGEVEFEVTPRTLANKARTLIQKGKDNE